MSSIVGIDPGLSGAVAVLDNAGHVIEVQDTPVLTIEKAKGVRHEFDRGAMVDIIRNIALRTPDGEATYVAMEKVQAMPGQGVTSMFSFGCGYGIWLGILSALFLPVDLIPPQRWKKSMMDGMSKEKDASRIRAKELFPTADLSLKKHHGRADALLIAEYRRRLG